MEAEVIIDSSNIGHNYLVKQLNVMTLTETQSATVICDAQKDWKTSFLMALMIAWIIQS